MDCGPVFVAAMLLFMELGNRRNDTEQTSLGSNALFTCDVCIRALFFAV